MEARNRLSSFATRHGAWFGLVGPAVFISGWVTAGSLRPEYSFRYDAISQLARIGAPNRLLMTSAFLGFGLSMPLFGRALADSLEDPKLLEAAIALAGIGTIAVAAIPLARESGGTEDLFHTIAAVLGYVGTASAPLIAARALSRRGRRGAAFTSLVVGSCSAVALGLTARGVSTGMYQRIGLTIVDLWFMAFALDLLHQAHHEAAMPDRSDDVRPGRRPKVGGVSQPTGHIVFPDR